MRGPRSQYGIDQSGPAGILKALMRKDSRGFTLILALGYISLMVLILSGLTVLLRNQFVIKRNYEAIEFSRHQAKLGLGVAKDELQFFLGKDTRALFDKGDGYWCLYDNLLGKELTKIPCDEDSAQLIEVTTGGSFKYWYEPVDSIEAYKGLMAGIIKQEDRRNLLDVQHAKVPFYELIKSYLSFTDEVKQFGRLKPRLQTTSQHGMGPVILGMEFYSKADQQERVLGLDMHVELILWNPYGVALVEAPYVIDIYSGDLEPHAEVSFKKLKQTERIELGERFFHETFSAGFGSGEIKRLVFDFRQLGRELEFEHEVEGTSWSLGGLRVELLLEGKGKMQSVDGIHAPGVGEGFVEHCHFFVQNTTCEHGGNPRMSSLSAVEPGHIEVGDGHLPEKKEARVLYNIASDFNEVESLAYLKGVNVGDGLYSVGSGSKSRDIKCHGNGKSSKRFYLQEDLQDDRGIYRLNEILWDECYLGGKEVRLGWGLFNVNSTSVSSWENLLKKCNTLDGEGVRILAATVVDRVKERGPFLSLSDFVGYNFKQRREGVLQEALSKLEWDVRQEEILEKIGNYLTIREEVIQLTVEALPSRGHAVFQRQGIFNQELLGRRFNVVRFFWD